MKTNPRRDVIKNATGVATPENGDVVNVPTTKKFSVAATTDKMGITTGGAITKGFIWGGLIATVVLLGVGMYTKKISLNYVK